MMSFFQRCLVVYCGAVFLLLLTGEVSAFDNDRHKSCSEWATRGECEANPNFMMTKCAQSCHQAIQAARIDTALLAHVKSFYDLSAHDIDGNVIDFGTLRDQVVVITNVASYCGYTQEHYQQLVALQEKTQEYPVTILAFPCNQFGAQEPGSPADIKTFVAQKGVTFRMMEKINVNGPEAHLVYKYLKAETETTNIAWNFATYFVVEPHTGDIEAYHGAEPMSLLPDIFESLQGEEL